ncbi:MAG: hypothetical protein AB2L11_09720 [Syntrophobacteraceae bacterium]
MITGHSQPASACKTEVVYDLRMIKSRRRLVFENCFLDKESRHYTIEILASEAISGALEPDILKRLRFVVEIWRGAFL